MQHVGAMSFAQSSGAPASSFRFGSFGAALTFAGSLLSGPVALVVVNSTHPQPAWAGAGRFVEHYHPVQALPFFFGFALVSGFVALVAALHAISKAEDQGRTGAALVLTAAFAAMIFTNYVLQTTFVPALVRDEAQANDSLLAAITMANPRSLGWALEMWGYGVLGVATWLVAPVFHGPGLGKAVRWAFAANAPVSVVPAFWTAFEPGWELRPAGIVSFAVWNLLVLAMAVLAFIWFRRKPGSLDAGSPAALTLANR